MEKLNQVVCEYEHMWTKTLGEMTTSSLETLCWLMVETRDRGKGVKDHSYLPGLLRRFFRFLRVLS